MKEERVIENGHKEKNGTANEPIDIIDLDSESEAKPSVEETKEYKKVKPEVHKSIATPKQVKMKSESLFFESQYEVHNDFIPQNPYPTSNNLGVENNFDYTITGSPEKTRIQRHKTIDLRKVKKMITTKLTTFDTSVKRIKLEPENLKKCAYHKALENGVPEKANQLPCTCEKYVRPNLFENVYKNMKTQNPSLSVHSYFIACLHSTKEHDMDLVNLGGSESELNFIFNSSE